MKNIQYITLTLFLSFSSIFAQSDALGPESVDALTASYLVIQKGLAKDNLESAQGGAKSFIKKLKKAPNEGKAAEQLTKLSTHSRTIAEAEDIKVARIAFHKLSNEMISLLEQTGTTMDTDLFVAHCPMAFAEGADWIQADKTVANPYYGAMMLRCGSINKQISGTHEGATKQDTPMKDHKHSGPGMHQ